MQIDDGVQSIGVELDFTAADIAYLGFEDEKLHIKATGTSSVGTNSSANCAYEGDPIAVSIEIKAPLEHPR